MNADAVAAAMTAKRYAMPILTNGRLAVPQEAECGYWVVASDHATLQAALRELRKWLQDIGDLANNSAEDTDTEMLMVTIKMVAEWSEFALALLTGVAK